MIASFMPSIARGDIMAPPSKSMAHRYMIAAALSDGKSRIDNISYSEDILATIDCIRAISATYTNIPWLMPPAPVAAPKAEPTEDKSKPL